MRPRVAIAVGPSFVQVKKLSGLPLLKDSAALSAVVREGAGRFFLKNGIPLVTTDVNLIEPGTGWAAAFDAPVVEQVQRACTDAGFTMQSIMPAAIAIGQVVGNGELKWLDGQMQAELSYHDRELTAIRQLRVAPDSEWAKQPEEDDLPLPGPTSGSLEGDTMRYADAYGATRVERGARMTLPIGNASRVDASSRIRLRIAAAVLFTSMIAALVVPPLLAIRSATRARTELALIAPEARKARDIERELNQVSDALQRVSEFAAESRSITFLLERLAAALPDHAAVVTLELDSARGTMVVLAPHTSQVTDALERMNVVTGVQVVGPITPTTTRAGVVERATIRFVLVRAANGVNTNTIEDTVRATETASPPVARTMTKHDSGGPS
jgi:hypothetical protein